MQEFGQLCVENARIDVNSDGLIDALDAELWAEQRGRSADEYCIGEYWCESGDMRGGTRGACKCHPIDRELILEQECLPRPKHNADVDGDGLVGPKDMMLIGEHLGWYETSPRRLHS